MDRLLSSPLMIFVYIFSAIAGVFVGFTIGGETFGVALAIILAFAFVLAIAAIEVFYRRKTIGDIKPAQDFSPVPKTVIVGGKVIDNVDLPDDVRKVFQQILQDADADGVLDLLQGVTAKEVTAEAIKDDQVHQLQEVKQMLEGGLITREEYQATVKQILSAK